MKIAFDSQIFAAQEYGGISRYCCEIASRLAQNPGVDVTISAPMYVNAYLDGLPKNSVSGFRAPKLAQFHKYSEASSLRLMLRASGLAMGDLMLKVMRPDIIHETYYSPYRLGSRSARRVLTLHDMIHEKFPKDFPNADKSARYKRLAAERADHIICNSKSTRQDAIDILGIDSKKTSIIYLGFDLMKRGKEEKSFIRPDKPYLLYVGNRAGYKNFAFLLEAFGLSEKYRNKFKLVCFGGGPFSEEELAAIKRFDLSSEQVVQLGGDDCVLAQVYESAEVFVYPSLYEGFGIPPLEAMAHDCPVICSNTSSIPEVVGDAGEYFNPQDRDSFLAALERLTTSAVYRGNLISRGRERLKNFSWDRCAAETMAVYNRLVE